MKRALITLFATTVIASIFSFNYFKNKKAYEQLFDKQVVDATHASSINPLFEKADALKYSQDYKKADLAFQDLLKRPLTATDSQYVLNQLAFINLNMNEDSTAERWIRQLEQMQHPLSIAAQADYNYNIGTWAYHTFKPKMAEQYLKNALEKYEKLYGNEHLKVALCLTQIGRMYYEFAGNAIDSSRIYLDLAGEIFKTKEPLKSYSAEWSLGMSYLGYLKWENDKSLLYVDNALNILKSKKREQEILYALCLSWKSLVVKKYGDMNKDIRAVKYHQADSLSNQAIRIGEQVSHSPLLQLIFRNTILLKSRMKDTASCHFYLDKLSHLLTYQKDRYANIERLRGFYSDKMGITRGENDNIKTIALKAYATTDFKKAIPLLQKAFEAENDSTILFYKSIALLGNGQSQDAKTLLTTLKSINTIPSESLDWYAALAYSETGDTDNAIILLKKLADTEGGYQAKATELLNKLKK